MKKIFAFILLFLLICGSVCTAAADAVSININGETVDFTAYNIDGNNYFKLRDLAYALSGTEGRFDVAWIDSAVKITTLAPYSGEKSTSIDLQNPEIVSSNMPIYCNEKRVSAKAYNIGGNNFFKLRDIAKIIDFGVFWSQDSGVFVDTSRGYALTAEEERALYTEYASRRHGEFIEQNGQLNTEGDYYNFGDVDRDGKNELLVKKGYGITIYKATDGEVKRMFCDPLPDSTGELQYHYVTYEGNDCIAYITKERIVLYILSGDSLSSVGELKPEEKEKINFPKRYTLNEITRAYIGTPSGEVCSKHKAI